MLDLNERDILEIAKGGLKYNPYLNGIDKNELIEELAQTSLDTIKKFENVSNLERPYIDLDEVQDFLNKLLHKVDNMVKKSEFENFRKVFFEIEENIITNLENQRDYLLDNYNEILGD